MNLSPFFEELSSSYACEIEDLTYDSGGSNVLESRLKVKRDLLADLLPMSELDPVMAASAFHGAFRFSKKEVLEELIARESAGFPSWEALAATIEIEPWAEELAECALEAPGGERFMLIAAGLEYIQSGSGAAAGDAGPGTAAEETRGEDSDGDDFADDLGEAGEDYLSEQGFDRRS